MKKVKGDLLSLQEGILVHGCNALGVMGAGVALLIRNKYPDVFRTYSDYHAEAGLRLGEIITVGSSKAPIMTQPLAYGQVHSLSAQLPERLIVVNAITQESVARAAGELVVSYDSIFACFAQVRLLARTTGLGVHFPLIGCGLAGGDWEVVEPLIEAALGPDVEATLWTL